MRRYMTMVTMVTMLLVVVWSAGCDGPKDSKTSGSGKNDAKSGGHDQADGHAHNHDHAAKGAHGGNILELGEEEYHAEWTHDDDSGKVTIYMLDSSMKNEAQIDAVEVTIETKVGDETKEHKLPAVAVNESDPPQASEFSIEDKSLVVALEAAGHEGTTATLKLTIKGKSYSAEITHDGHAQ